MQINSASNPCLQCGIFHSFNSINCLEIKLKMYVNYWSISSKKRNKLMHCINGNVLTPKQKRRLRRIHKIDDKIYDGSNYLGDIHDVECIPKNTGNKLLSKTFWIYKLSGRRIPDPKFMINNSVNAILNEKEIIDEEKIEIKEKEKIIVEIVNLEDITVQTKIKFEREEFSVIKTKLETNIDAYKKLAQFAPIKLPISLIEIKNNVRHLIRRSIYYSFSLNTDLKSLPNLI